MAFVDLEKAFDRIPRRVLWWALQEELMPWKSSMEGNGFGSTWVKPSFWYLDRDVLTSPAKCVSRVSAQTSSSVSVVSVGSTWDTVLSRHSVQSLISPLRSNDVLDWTGPPIWRPPKQADTVRPGLVFYNRDIPIDMGVGGTLRQKIAIYKALILSHGPCVFSAGGGGLVFKTTHAVEDSAYEVKDLLGGGGLCTWHRSLFCKWKQLLFAWLNRDVLSRMYVVSFMIRKKHICLSSLQDAFAYVHGLWCFWYIYICIP